MSPFLGPHTGLLTNSAISAATREDRGFIKEERLGAKEGTGGCAGGAPNLLLWPPSIEGSGTLMSMGTPIAPSAPNETQAGVPAVGTRTAHGACTHLHTAESCMRTCTHTQTTTAHPCAHTQLSTAHFQEGWTALITPRHLLVPSPPRPHAPNSSPPPPAHPGVHPWVLPDVANKVLSGTPPQEQGAGWGGIGRAGGGPSPWPPAFGEGQHRRGRTDSNGKLKKPSPKRFPHSLAQR